MKYLSLFKESTETKFDFDKMIEHISNVNDILESLLEDTNLTYGFIIIVEYDYEIIFRNRNQFKFFPQPLTNLKHLILIKNEFLRELDKHNTWRIILGISVLENKKGHQMVYQSGSLVRDSIESDTKEALSLINERLKDEDFLEYNSESSKLKNPNVTSPVFFQYTNTTSFFYIH